MITDSERTPKGRVVEIDGVQYQVIRSKLYRYADQKIGISQHGAPRLNRRGKIIKI